MNPLVTIVIPVYNGENYLAEAIDSALSQDYENIEVLVVNDGSNDSGATRSIALSYGTRIRFFEKENGGVASALNMAIKNMNGQYFSWLSHDDKYYSHKVSQQVSFLNQVKRKDVIPYSDFDIINERGEITANSLMPKIDPQDFQYWITSESRLHGCTLLIPKECFLEFGMFDESLRTTQDYDLWFKIGSRYEFLHLPNTLISARHHSNQTFNLNRTIGTEEINLLSISFFKSLNNRSLLNGSRIKELSNNFYLNERFLASYYVCRTAITGNNVNVVQKITLAFLGLKSFVKMQTRYRFLLRLLDGEKY